MSSPSDTYYHCLPSQPFIHHLSTIAVHVTLSASPPPVAAYLLTFSVKHAWTQFQSTIADDLGGAPFGNVVSFSDGLPDKGAGVPYFYLTTLDPTARHALKDHRSSFTIREYPLGTCGKADPENPTCSKITLTGKLNEVDAKSEEAATAKICKTC